MVFGFVYFFLPFEWLICLLCDTNGAYRIYRNVSTKHIIITNNLPSLWVPLCCGRTNTHRHRIAFTACRTQRARVQLDRCLPDLFIYVFNLGGERSNRWAPDKATHRINTPLALSFVLYFFWMPPNNDIQRLSRRYSCQILFSERKVGEIKFYWTGVARQRLTLFIRIVWRVTFGPDGQSIRDS